MTVEPTLDMAEPGARVFSTVIETSTNAPLGGPLVSIFDKADEETGEIVTLYEVLTWIGGAPTFRFIPKDDVDVASIQCDASPLRWHIRHLARALAGGKTDFTPTQKRIPAVLHTFMAVIVNGGTPRWKQATKASLDARIADFNTELEERRRGRRSRGAGRPRYSASDEGRGVAR